MSPVVTRGPVIALKLQMHAQCVLTSSKQAESFGSPQRNIDKYSDYVVITTVNYLQDIPLTISAKQLNYESQHTRSCTCVTANFKSDFLSLKLSTRACSVLNNFGF